MQQNWCISGVFATYNDLKEAHYRAY